jgi:preprotein translocase subunit YajC
VAGTFLIILILLALGWFLLILPSRRRQRSHAAMQDSLELGDEIITAGGMHGTIREVGESELRVEIAPQVVVTLDRRAVAAVARDVEDHPVEGGPVPEEEPEPR